VSRQRLGRHLYSRSRTIFERNLMERCFRALMIWFLSVWHDLSQRQLGLRSGISEKRLSNLLRRDEIPDEDYERLLAATRSEPAEIQVVTGCIEGLQAVARNRDLSAGEQEEVECGVREAARLLRATLREIALRSRSMPAFDGYPRPADLEAARWLAGMQWSLLESMTEEQQLAVVRRVREFQNWALMEKVCDESEVQASRDLDRAAFLARLAEEVAERVRGPEEWRSSARGYAVGHAANVTRVIGDLKGARTGLEGAKRLWGAGSDPDHVLDPGRLLDLEASLCRANRRFEDALACLDEAFPVSRRPAHILIKKGFTLEAVGEYKRAIEALVQAGPLVEREGDARLQYMQRFNLAVNYSHLGAFHEACNLLGQVREAAAERGDENEMIRVIWLEGRIAAGLRRVEEARDLLEQASRKFASRKMWYDVALAELEVMVLLLEEGRTADIKAVARGLAEAFKVRGVHREALAALQLLEEAVQRDEATSELAIRVLRFLFQARHDHSLRFTRSGAFAAAAGVHSAPLVDLERGGGGTAAAGVPPAAGIEGRSAPQRGEKSPELVEEDRPAGSRDQEGGGEGDSGEIWTHRRVSSAAPASGLRDPGGPRLSGMLRQSDTKNPIPRGVDRPMKKENRIVRLARALAGKSQERFGEEVRVAPKMIGAYEAGDRTPGAETTERVAAGAGLTVRDAEDILRFADTLARPRSRNGQTAADLRDDLTALVSRFHERVLRLPLPQGSSLSKDGRSTEDLWRLLADLTEDQRSAVVTAGRPFQSQSLAARFRAESEAEATRDPERAASLARTAERIVELVAGTEESTGSV
jgi:tetratricopeptide (TPR) repeat protein/DNA-binding XRE family transcriptional regulator